MDVSNQVDVTDATAVASAIRGLLEQRYPGESFALVDRLVADLKRLYEGDYPGYHGCEVSYHNIQHVLDVALAMARLIDGHDKTVEAGAGLGPDNALIGICAALFHDTGYIRRRRDTRHRNGAAYTRVHVDRSARWLREYLPTVGLDELTGPCARLVQFTNCSRHPDQLRVRGEAERLLGDLLGTADLIAQLADVHYVEKCRNYLYDEFVEGGIAGASAAEGYSGATYQSAQDLVDSTPAFIRWVIRERLEEGFRGAYRYAAKHFGGSNLYMDAIHANYTRLEATLNPRSPARG